MDKENCISLFKQVLNKLQNIEIERDILKNKVEVNNISMIDQIVEMIGGKISNIKNNFNEYFDILEELNKENNKLAEIILNQKGGAKKKKKSSKKKSSKKKASKKKSSKKKSSKKKVVKKKSSKKKTSTKKKYAPKKVSKKKSKPKKKFTNKSSESFPSLEEQSSQKSEKQVTQKSEKQVTQKKQQKDQKRQHRQKKQQTDQKKQSTQTVQDIQIPEVKLDQLNEDDSETNEAPNISESPTMQNKQIEEMSDDEFNFEQEQEGGVNLLESGNKISSLLKSITSDLLI